MSFKFFNKNKKPKVNQHNSLARPTEPVNTVKLHEIKRRHLAQEDQLDAEFGYSRYTDSTPLPAFIFNLRETYVIQPDTNEEHAAVDIYCLQEDGSTFKATYIYHPYVLLKVKDEQPLPEVEEWMGRYFQGAVLGVEEAIREDLDLPNHLSGKRQRYIKLTFRTTNDLQMIRREINRIIAEHKRLSESQEQYALTGFQDTAYDLNFGGNAMYSAGGHSSSNAGNSAGSVELAREKDTLDKIMGDKRASYEKITDTFIELREFDVPYLQRVCIDTRLRAGLWYDFCVLSGQNSCTFTPRPDLESRPQMRILAYDIETCKAPLKFPNSQVDQIMMISLMCDGHGHLFTNRQIVSEDVEDFEYTPKPEYEGPFTIINCSNEKTMLEAFIKFIKDIKPQIIVSYNGDFFDFPYVDARALKHGISLEKELAISLIQDSMSSEYKGRFIVHLDAFHWVQRDSYLPQGSQGLKAVTKAKLKYNPIELDPEDMMPYAQSKPKILAQYSVSDAVATYYLYLKYVHLFIFSLCTIIPLTPNEVLRKGSGTLCETLLMVQAYEHTVIAPNKQQDELLKFYKGHLLESETYVGAHVECLHSGVYRADIPIKFELKQTKLRELINEADGVLRFAIEKEWKKKVEDVENYEEVRDKILAQLQHLYDNPVSYIKPLIYHLDVGAMYPNIILTNRLQPYAIVDETICATCDYNIPNALCKRTLEWTWRGKYFVPTKADYSHMVKSLEQENLSPADREKFGVANNTKFLDLHPQQQAELIKNRVKTYARKVYRKLTEEKVENRYATTCQREHPFYIDTVRAFRDRRYLYKELNKTWGNNLSAAKKEGNALREAQCKDMILLYDSMQLAHKCILNSFYGYVMRKGSRWSSMPMAGVVTRTGSKLIQRAEDLVCAVGKVLELDTDGIWCVLPDNFPENFKLKHKDGSVFKMSYPCSVLNHQVDAKHTNHQYHQLPDGWATTEEYKQGKPPQYDIVSECSIFFEVDGPYKAMVLPASQHEGENIKKRYAVFNFDGSIAELKGFEIKRRGELKLIKVFQEDVFKVFLLGKDLVECYAHVGAAANKWLDVLFSKGRDLEDAVVFDLISENKSMSERLEDYGAARSTSITCARRLGEFLGAEMVKDKGLNCHFIISKYPLGAPVSERAVPVKIWDSPEHIKKYYLKQWLNESSLTDFDIRNVVDWDYYTTRLNSAIQKIITIPAAFQDVANPVPRVIHPDWLNKQIKKRSEAGDKNIKLMFKQENAKQGIIDENNNNSSDDENFARRGDGKNHGMNVKKVTYTSTSTFGRSTKKFSGKNQSAFDEFNDLSDNEKDNDIEDFSNNKNKAKNSKVQGIFQNRKMAAVLKVDGVKGKDNNFDGIDDDDDVVIDHIKTKKNNGEDDENEEEQTSSHDQATVDAILAGIDDDEDILNMLQDHSQGYNYDGQNEVEQQPLTLSKQIKEKQQHDKNKNDKLSQTTTSSSVSLQKRREEAIAASKQFTPGSAEWIESLQDVWIAEAAEKRKLRQQNDKNNNEMSTATMIKVIEEREKRLYKQRIAQERKELNQLLYGNDETDDDDDNDDNNKMNDEDLTTTTASKNKKKNNKKNNKDTEHVALLMDDDADDIQTLLSNYENIQKSKLEEEKRLELEQRKKQRQLNEKKIWHIIYIQPHPSKHGVFNIWLIVETIDLSLNNKVINKKMHKISILVDRVLLINASIPLFDGKLPIEGGKSLPHGAISKYLYQVELDEKSWQQDKSTILNNLYAADGVENIYQHDLSLLFKTILDLGNMIYGLDEKKLELDPITKRPINKIWHLDELLNHSNQIVLDNQLINSYDRYLLTPQDIHLTTTLNNNLNKNLLNNNKNQQQNGSNNNNNNGTFTPLLIFHRESNDLYLNNYAPNIVLDKQRVFFGIYDPTRLEIIIIAGGPGANRYKEDLLNHTNKNKTNNNKDNTNNNNNQQYNTAQHSKYLQEYCHEDFIKWFISAHITNTMNNLMTLNNGEYIKQIGGIENINIVSHILNNKLKITHHFSNNAIDSYKYLNKYLSERNDVSLMNDIDDDDNNNNMNGDNIGLPILPIIDTTQDMNLIATLYYQQLQQQQQQQQQQQSQQVGNTNTASLLDPTQHTLNEDYSLSFIIQSYPYIATHSPLPSTSLSSSTNNNTQQQQQQQQFIDNPFLSLSWVLNSILSMYTNISNIYQNYIRRLHLSRLIKIPICNIPHDITLYIFDILFARSLIAHNHVIWFNPASTIDITSTLQLSNNMNIVTPYSNIITTYNNNDGSSTSLSNQQQQQQPNDLDLLNPQLIIPGCYRNICFDITLDNFALNAFLNYTHLPDQIEQDSANTVAQMVGGNDGNNNNNNKADKNEMEIRVQSDPAALIFRVLRMVILQLLTQKEQFLRQAIMVKQQTNVVEQQLQQIQQHDTSYQLITTTSTTSTNNTNNNNSSSLQQRLIILNNIINYITIQTHHIELLLRSAYRYVTSSQYAMLYDHYLHIYIHKIMKKTLILMVKDITKLHMTIIVASFERLILSTDKTQSTIAFNRLSSVLEYIKNQPLFNKLRFTPTALYHSLLFMDLFNFSAILENLNYISPQQLQYEQEQELIKQQQHYNGNNNDDNDNDDFYQHDNEDGDEQQYIKQEYGNDNNNMKKKKHKNPFLVSDDDDDQDENNNHNIDINDDYDLELIKKQAKMSTKKGNNIIGNKNNGIHDDDDDLDDFFNEDEDNVDGSIVDIDGTILNKHLKRRHMSQLLEMGAVDFGQLTDNNKKKNNKYQDQQQETLPLNNNDDNDGILSIDDQEYINNNKLVSLTDQNQKNNNNNKKPKLASKFAEQDGDFDDDDDGYYYDDNEDDDYYDDEEDDEHEEIGYKPKKKSKQGIHYDLQYIDDDHALYSSQQQLERKRQRLKQGKLQSGKGNRRNQTLSDGSHRHYLRNNDDDDDIGDDDDEVPYHIDNGIQQYDDEEIIALDGATNIDTDNQWIVQNQWNIASFLPQYAEQRLIEMIQSFLYMPFLAFTQVEDDYIETLRSGNNTGIHLFQKIAEQEEEQNGNNGQKEQILSKSGSIPLNLIENQTTQQGFFTMEPKKRHEWYKVKLLEFVKNEVQAFLLQHISLLSIQQTNHLRDLREHVMKEQLLLQQLNENNNDLKRKNNNLTSTSSTLSKHNTHNNNETTIIPNHVTNINNSNVFPRRPGKHLDMNNVSLEYIKMFCHILSLDSYIKDEVLNIKTTCLAKLQVQPFTDLSHYKQPCRTFILPNVCCTKCGYTKDIDLCRDTSLFLGHAQQQQQLSVSGGNNNTNGLVAGTTQIPSSPWSCQQCHTKYNKYEIECRLIHIIRQLLISYQTQDFICTKCKQMKAEMLSFECPQCCIPYVQTRTYTQQKNIFISLYHIAKEHRFMFLFDMLTWVIKRR